MVPRVAVSSCLLSGLGSAGRLSSSSPTALLPRTSFSSTKVCCRARQSVTLFIPLAGEKHSLLHDQTVTFQNQCRSFCDFAEKMRLCRRNFKHFWAFLDQKKCDCYHYWCDWIAF